MKNNTLLAIFLLIFLSAGAMGAYATYRHNAFYVADGKDIDLAGNSIGNGTINVNISGDIVYANSYVSVADAVNATKDVNGNANKELRFPSGRYGFNFSTDPIVLPNNTHIICANNATLYGNSTVSGYIFTAKNNVMIEGCTFDGIVGTRYSSVEATGSFIDARNSTNVMLKNNIAYNMSNDLVGFEGNSFQPAFIGNTILDMASAAAANFDGSINGIIQNNRIYVWDTSFHTVRSKNLRILNNDMSVSLPGGMVLDGIFQNPSDVQENLLIQGNTIHDSYIGYAAYNSSAGNGIMNLKNITIVNNVFNNISQNGIVFTFDSNVSGPITIRDNLFLQNYIGIEFTIGAAWSNYTLSNVDISNNRFYSGTYGINQEVSGWTGPVLANSSITNNIFSSMAEGARVHLNNSIFMNNVVYNSINGYNSFGNSGGTNKTIVFNNVAVVTTTAWENPSNWRSSFVVQSNYPTP